MMKKAQDADAVADVVKKVGVHNVLGKGVMKEGVTRSDIFYIHNVKALYGTVSRVLGTGW